MTHLNAVAETICTQTSTKGTLDSKYLTVATEMFFSLTNDAEADVRILADECLTRVRFSLLLDRSLLLERTLLQVVKTSSETGQNVGRMQVELYKEIKKNGSARSLRSALTKFAAIADQIRPQKCRAYIVNLLPCLIKISARQEESVHETLAESVTAIFRVLGAFC